MFPQSCRPDAVQNRCTGWGGEGGPRVRTRVYAAMETRWRPALTPNRVPFFKRGRYNGSREETESPEKSTIRKIQISFGTN